MKLYLALLASRLLSATTAAAKPNVIFILVDDMGYSDLGLVPNERADKSEQPALAADVELVKLTGC